MKLQIRYPNLTLFAISVIAAIVLSFTGVFGMLFGNLGSLGFVGAFLAGVLLPITFTAPMATAALYFIGGQYDITTSAVLATLGALVGDLAIFTFVKDGTLSEIEQIREDYRRAHGRHDHHKRHRALMDLFKSRPFHAIAMFLGGILILSPLPDEFGVAIFASYKVKLKQFIPLSVLLNGVGIVLILLIGCGCSVLGLFG